MEAAAAKEEDGPPPRKVVKKEIKTEEEEEEDAWLASSCFEDEEEERKVKFEEKLSASSEEEEEEEEEDHVSTRAKEQLEKSRCLVVLRDCLSRKKGANYTAVAKWLLREGSIVVKEEAGNFCQFTCSQCEETFQSYSSIMGHKKKNGCNHKQTQMSAVSAHMCSICSMIVLNDLAHLSTHFREKHQISFQNHALHPMKTDLDSDVIKRLKQETPIITTQFDHYVTSPKSVPCEKVTDAVENLCIFGCKCSFITNSFRALMNHSKKCQESGKVSLRTITKFIIEARYHCCRVCARRVLCDKGLIQCHFRSAHHLGHVGYAQLVGKKGKQNVIKAETKAKEEATRFADLLKNVPIITPHKTSITLPSSLPKAMTTQVVENLCKYRCREGSCPFSASSWNVMRGHMQKYHELPTFTYHPTSLVEARYHKCRLCSKDMLCDKRAIYLHLYTCHQISLKQYKLGATGKHRQQSEGAAKAQKIVRYKRLFCKNSISHEFVSRKAANACTFTCPNCGKKWVSSAAFRNHLSRCCGKSTVVPQHVTEARYYECSLCSRLMLCDFLTVTRHIQCSHSTITSPKTYMEKVSSSSKEETQEIRQKVLADNLYWKKAIAFNGSYKKSS